MHKAALTLYGIPLALLMLSAGIAPAKAAAGTLGFAITKASQG